MDAMLSDLKIEKKLMAAFAVVILAIVASVLAGLLPAWRAMQVTPAIQLKSQ